MCTVLACRVGVWGGLLVCTMLLLISLRCICRILSGERWRCCIIARLCCLCRLLIRLITMVSIVVILSMCLMVLLLRLMTLVRRGCRV